MRGGRSANQISWLTKHYYLTKWRPQIKKLRLFNDLLPPFSCSSSHWPRAKETRCPVSFEFFFVLKAYFIYLRMRASPDALRFYIQIICSFSPSDSECRAALYAKIVFLWWILVDSISHSSYTNSLLGIAKTTQKN